MQGLHELLIPTYGRNRDEAVTIDDVHPFPYLVGGSATFRSLDVETNAALETSVGTVGFLPLHSLPDFLRPGAGLKFRVKNNDEGSSFSILVPGENSLTKEGCLDNEANQIRLWAFRNSDCIWKAVDGLYFTDRPGKLFLVFAQTRTNSYAIAHSQSSSHECEIEFTANVELPAIAQCRIFSGYKVISARAGFGFDLTRDRSESPYAIFLHVCLLPPSRRIIQPPKLPISVWNRYGYGTLML